MFTSTGLEVKLVGSWIFPVSFEIVGWDVTLDFVFFSDLEQLVASFPVEKIFHESSIQTAPKFEWDGFEKFYFSICHLIQVEK